MSFTMFDKFGDAAACLPDEQRRELYVAACEYGFTGEMPEGLSPVVGALMAVMREDIDNSKASRSQGKRGGRPQKSGTQRPEDSETVGFQKSETGGSQDSETPPLQKPETPPLQKPETPPFDETETGGFGKTETQTRPDQTNTDQTKEREKRARPRFIPPTAEEVAAHVAEKGYCFDPAAFTAYYESVGWKINGNAMKSWRAACATWERRERAGKGGAAHGPGDVYSKL